MVQKCEFCSFCANKQHDFPNTAVYKYSLFMHLTLLQKKMTETCSGRCQKYESSPIFVKKLEIRLFLDWTFSKERGGEWLAGL